MQIIIGIIVIVVGILIAVILLSNTSKNREIIDENTGALNDYAFEQLVSQNVKLNSTMRILVLICKNKNELKEQYNTSFRDMIKDTYDCFKRVAGRSNVYYLQQGRFAIIVPKNCANENDFANKVVSNVERLYSSKNIEAKDHMAVALISLPIDAQDVAGVYKLIKYIEILPPLNESSIVGGNEIDKVYRDRAKLIDEAIDRAIKNDSFEIHYQPVFLVDGKNVVGAEALLRLRDEFLGEISPGELIPVAEKTGKIKEIGIIVLRKVCEFLRDNDIKKYGLSYIEINLSITECLQEDLDVKIEKVIEEYGIDRNLIYLEIRESALLNNQTVIQNHLEQLNELGYGLTLDEYGTGHSTFGYIMTLPFKNVKIDRSLLWNAMESTRDMYALCASISLLKDMDTKIIVEGAESEEMVDRLKQLRCDYVQGFFFSKPMNRKDFSEFMSNS